MHLHDPVLNIPKLPGANLRYVRERPPHHLQKALHDNPADAVEGACVAFICSADSRALAAVVAAAPRVVLDLSGRLDAQLETMAEYEGVGR